MALVEDVIFRNPLVTEKLAQMFNNKKCCDTVFLVNETQFHASSHLITVSNAKINSIVDTHFENCGDRYIRIGPVKHNESFLFLLKYMYGIPINFTQMDKAVMCEVLSLCELYEFNEFFKELKSYFAQFDCIDTDSLVVLLNTSKKYYLKELYEKCTIFAYKNTDQFVNHASFVDLQYHVLLDLIKSDRFCTKEVDILRRTLNWHSNNLNSDVSHNQAVVLQVENDIEEENDEYFFQISKKKKNKRKRVGVFKKNSDITNISMNEVVETQLESQNSEIVKTFSENVLKVLLSNIRIVRISCLDMLKFLKLPETQEYHKFLSDENFFSDTCEPRNKYDEELHYNLELEIPDLQAMEVDKTHNKNKTKNKTCNKETAEEERKIPIVPNQNENTQNVSFDTHQREQDTLDSQFQIVGKHKRTSNKKICNKETAEEEGKIPTLPNQKQNTQNVSFDTHQKEQDTPDSQFRIVGKPKRKNKSNMSNKETAEQQGKNQSVPYHRENTIRDVTIQNDVPLRKKFNFNTYDSPLIAALSEEEIRFGGLSLSFFSEHFYTEEMENESLSTKYFLRIFLRCYSHEPVAPVDWQCSTEIAIRGPKGTETFSEVYLGEDYEYTGLEVEIGSVPWYNMCHVSPDNGFYFWATFNHIKVQKTIIDYLV